MSGTKGRSGMIWSGVGVLALGAALVAGVVPRLHQRAALDHLQAELAAPRLVRATPVLQAGASVSTSYAEAMRAEALALSLCTTTAALKQRLFPDDHPTHLVVAGVLSGLAALRGDKQAALTMREDILARTLKIYGPAHTKTGYAQFNLAVSYGDAGDFVRAEALYRQALATLQQQLGPDHRSTLVVKKGGMVVICAGTTGYNLTMDARFLWMRQKRVQGSHFANLLQASQANQLMLERRLDPCMSEVFPFADIPAAHEKMLDNKHLPGNMAVLVTSPKPGLRTVEDVLEAGPTAR